MNTLPLRFWNKVCALPDGCWRWTGCESGKAGNRRGIFRWKGTNVFAHRLAYLHLVGDIPTGLELDHLCRNTLCVNPNHLEPVSHRENILRGMAARTGNTLEHIETHCPQGHLYDGANTYICSKGHRHCRSCMRTRSSRRYAQNRELCRREQLKYYWTHRESILAQKHRAYRLRISRSSSSAC